MDAVRRRLLKLLLSTFCLFSEGNAHPHHSSGDEAADPTKLMNQIAESYVKLVLAVGQHDPDYVDAYYGPEAWRKEAEARKDPLGVIKEKAAATITQLRNIRTASQPEIVRLRHQYLLKQLQALAARADMLDGRRLKFDEESKALYDAVAPSYPDSHFLAALDRLEKLVPGEGPLVERYGRFRQKFVIPLDRLDKVFSAAIEESRKRTKQHMDLPEGESFRVEYVTGKPWGGYNWYKGNSHSVIQVNTDLPVYIDRAVDLAAHEGYPGHHVYNVLLEQHLVRERGWIEFTVYPLFSPQSLIAEGTANYGIEVAFPGRERIAFERSVLFPLAGLDASQIDKYYAANALVEGLTYAGNEAARHYLNGDSPREQTVEWLAKFAMMPPQRARQRLDFIDKYRSYVINYNLGKDLVKHYIESKGGTPEDPKRRWNEFRKLISSPRLPSGLH